MTHISGIDTIEYVEIPVEAIINGEVVEVATKPIPVQKVLIDSPPV